MGKSIARKRKRVFQGNRYSKNDKIVTKDETASSSKLDNSLLNNNDETTDFTGNRIIDISILKLVFGKLACPKCLNLSLVFEEDSRFGLCSRLTVKCSDCDFSEGFSSTPKINKSSEINIRLVYGMRQLGKGHSGAKLLCATLNLPPPPVEYAFRKTKLKVLKAVTEVAQASMNRASGEIKDMSTKNSDKYISCGVSVDGTWQRRGHTSLNGCVAAISIDTGKVLDVEAMSSYCSTCKKISAMPGIKKESSNADHICRCNYEGTAGNMEVIGASRIFRRSIERRGLIYDKYFGDGDSKAYEKVKNMYDVKKNGKKLIVDKFECIGHVQKRVGTKLRKLKKTVKGLSGKGKLTDAFIDKLQNYYGIAIRSNKGDLKNMQQGVIAALFHCASFNESPMHGQCPVGENSWCFYQRAIAAGNTPDCKSRGLKKDILNVVKKVYMELCSKELLSKCVHGKTQNANESFNGNIWHRVPKECFVALETFQLGVYDSVIQFNDGFSGCLEVLKVLNFNDIGYFTAKCYKFFDMTRISESIRHSTSTSKQRRKISKAERKKKISASEKKEGISYKKGAY